MHQGTGVVCQVLIRYHAVLYYGPYSVRQYVRYWADQHGTEYDAGAGIDLLFGPCETTTSVRRPSETF